jgi:tetratricopeptide (TPR) repeat protein
MPESWLGSRRYAVGAAGTALLLAFAAIALRPADLYGDNAPPQVPAGVTEYAATSNAEKAEALVQTAINLTDSDRALKLLWQATNIDPALEDPYIYLGLYYNSRSDFDQVVQVYQKLVKYQPKESSAYLNIGEAYMSFTPPRTDDALIYYRKALDLDPASSFAALRMGEIYAQQGNREMAVRYLKIASGDLKNPDVAAEANHYLSQMGAS